MQTFAFTITRNNEVIETRQGFPTRQHAWDCVQRHIADHIPELLPIPLPIIDSVLDAEGSTEMQLGGKYFAQVFPQDQHQS